MAVSRFELRKQLVLEEADALGTSLLRAQLIPAPAGPEIAALLGQYVKVRVQYGCAGDDLARLTDLNRQTARLQTELWTKTVSLCTKESKSGGRRLVVAILESGHRRGRSSLDGV